MMKIFRQRGSATALAIFAMIFLGIVIAGLLPMLTQEMRAAVSDKDLLQARYAAEAGAKRAVQALDQKIAAANSWTWLGANNNNILDTSMDANYSVVLTPIIDSTHALDTSGTYTITSTGRAGGATKTVNVTYRFTPPSTPSGSKILWEPPTDARYNNTTQWAGLSNGDMIAYNGNQVNNNTNPGYLLGTTASNSGFQWGLPVTTSVQNVFLDLLDTSFFKPNNPRFSAFTRKTMDAAINPNIIYGSSWGNLWGAVTLPSGKSMFEVQGDVAINTPLSTGPNDQILIYSHGNININYPLQGNFAFVAEGVINLNAHSQHNGQQEFYSIGNIEVSPSVSGYGVFMTRGALHVTSSYYVKAFMYGRNNVIVDVNGQITGAVYSNGSIRMNSNTVLTYDPSAIPRQ